VLYRLFTRTRVLAECRAAVHSAVQFVGEAREQRSLYTDSVYTMAKRDTRILNKRLLYVHGFPLSQRRRVKYWAESNSPQILHAAFSHDNGSESCDFTPHILSNWQVA
jgi:hypothetical protein